MKLSIGHEGCLILKTGHSPQSVSQSINQSINHSISQSVRQSISQSVSQSIRYNRPRSIYQYSNMALRLSGQTSIFGVVFFVFKYPLGIERQKKLRKFTILTQKPQAMLEY